MTPWNSCMKADKDDANALPTMTQHGCSFGRHCDASISLPIAADLTLAYPTNEAFARADQRSACNIIGRIGCLRLVLLHERRLQHQSQCHCYWEQCHFYGNLQAATANVLVRLRYKHVSCWRNVSSRCGKTPSEHDISFQNRVCLTEVFMLQPDATGSFVYLEDRANVGYSSPNCLTTQVSQLLSYSINSNIGSAFLSGTWTRPLQLPSSLISDGYVNIASGKRVEVASVRWRCHVPRVANSQVQ